MKLFLGLALLMSIMFTTVMIIPCERYGLTRHMWDIPLDKYEGMAFYTWLAEFAQLTCSGFTKVSVLLFFRRMVDGTYSRYWQIAVWGAIAFTVAWATAFTLVLFFNCEPMEAYWKVSCFNLVKEERG